LICVVVSVDPPPPLLVEHAAHVKMAAMASARFMADRMRDVEILRHPSRELPMGGLPTWVVPSPK
jgi:hypothetical protein